MPELYGKCRGIFFLYAAWNSLVHIISAYTPVPFNVYKPNTTYIFIYIFYIRQICDIMMQYNVCTCTNDMNVGESQVAAHMDGVYV